MRVSYNSILLVITILTVYLFSCQTRKKNPAETDQIVKKPDNIILNKILKEKKLIATTDYNSTNYFVYRGEPMGYQYELLKSFTKFLGVKLEIKIINNLESSFDCLNEDECDLIAVGLTVTKERSNIVDFSSPLSQTRQVLVQRKPDNWRKMRTMDEINSHLIRNPLNLAGKTIYIQKNTIFYSRLNNLSDEIGADINIIEHPDATVEELITMVSKGEIDYTVCDEHIALVNKKYYPDIDVRTPISFPQHIAWAVKKGANGLLDTINFWLEEFIKTRTSAFLYNKYFRNSYLSTL